MPDQDPDTLPADFFSKQKQQPVADPDTLPADFFSGQHSPEDHSAAGVVAHGLGQLISNGPAGSFVGAIKRYGIDIPGEHLEQFQKDLKGGNYGNAAISLLQASPGPGTLSAMAKDAWDASSRYHPIDAAAKGDYAGAANATLGKFPLVGPMLAGGNTQLGAAIEDAKKGNYYDAAGNLGAGAGAYTNLLAPEAAKSDLIPMPKGGMGDLGDVFKAAKDKLPASLGGIPSVADQHSFIMQGLRPGTNPVTFKESLKRSMPDLKEAESAYGKPVVTQDDLIGNPETGEPGVVKLAKQTNRAQFRSLFPEGSSMLQEDTTPVADAIRSKITPYMKKFSPGKAADLEAKAKQYEGSHSIEEIDNFLQGVNGDLDSYYAKNPSARSAAMSNPDTAGLVAEGGALRKTLYDALDKPGQGKAAAELQKRYGALSDFEQAAYKRKNVVERQAPQNVTQQLGNVAAAMKVAKGTLKLAKLDPGGISDIGEAVAGHAMSNYVRELNSTNSLIKRAFDGYSGKSSAITMPPKWTGLADQPSRLLGPKTQGPESGPGLDPIIVPPSVVPGTSRSRVVNSPLPKGSGNNRLLNKPSSIQGNPGAFGMSMGEDLVPIKNKNGQIEYVPKWTLQKP